MNAQNSNPLAVSLLLCLTLLMGSGCKTATTAGETYELGVIQTVQTKGSYESAAYCFLREYRKDRNPVMSGTMTPIVEIDPSEDYAELLLWGGPLANYNMMVVKFVGTDGGNSMAEVYVSTYLSHNYWKTRKQYARELVADTKKCQLEEGAEIE